MENQVLSGDLESAQKELEELQKTTTKIEPVSTSGGDRGRLKRASTNVVALGCKE
jgi:hypothetical protein